MQADLCDIRQRNLRRAVELDGIAVKARELAHEELLALARRVERDVDFLALLAHEVARLAQDAVMPGEDTSRMYESGTTSPLSSSASSFSLRA